jgi:hypothetical protein
MEHVGQMVICWLGKWLGKWLENVRLLDTYFLLTMVDTMVQVYRAAKMAELSSPF